MLCHTATCLQGRRSKARTADEISEPTKPEGLLNRTTTKAPDAAASAAEPIRATEKTLDATGLFEPLQPADASARLAPTEPRKPLQAPQASERTTPVDVMPAKPGATLVGPSRGDTAKPAPTVDPAKPGGTADQGYRSADPARRSAAALRRFWASSI
jgi:hypothetical protein